MRISGGTGRGKRLRTPRGLRVRPTSDKVKQALFNILGERVRGADFLDLYAGAGSVGIEALSRGARRVVFVDGSNESVRFVRRNLAASGLEGPAEVVRADASAFLKKRPAPFDIVFLDPPYAEDLGPLLARIAGAETLKAGSVVIAEHFRKQQPPEKAGDLVLYRTAQYGDTALAFYKETT